MLRWKKKYGGLMPLEMKQLRQLEENGQLMRILADFPWRRRCYRTSSEDGYETSAEAGTDRRRYFEIPVGCVTLPGAARNPAERP